MFKRLITICLVALVLMAVTGCEKEVVLTELQFVGMVDTPNIPYGSTFNVYDGITVVGNDGLDYSEYIRFETTATVSDTGLLDTLTPGEAMINYTVQVGLISASKWRYIYVLEA